VPLNVSVVCERVTIFSRPKRHKYSILCLFPQYALIFLPYILTASSIYSTSWRTNSTVLCLFAFPSAFRNRC